MAFILFSRNLTSNSKNTLNVSAAMAPGREVQCHVKDEATRPILNVIVLFVLFPCLSNN